MTTSVNAIQFWYFYRIFGLKLIRPCEQFYWSQNSLLRGERVENIEQVPECIYQLPYFMSLFDLVQITVTSKSILNLHHCYYYWAVFMTSKSFCFITDPNGVIQSTEKLRYHIRDSCSYSVHTENKLLLCFQNPVSSDSSRVWKSLDLLLLPTSQDFLLSFSPFPLILFVFFLMFQFALVAHIFCVLRCRIIGDRIKHFRLHSKWSHWPMLVTAQLLR